MIINVNPAPSHTKDHLNPKVASSKARKQCKTLTKRIMAEGTSLQVCTRHILPKYLKRETRDAPLRGKDFVKFAGEEVTSGDVDSNDERDGSYDLDIYGNGDETKDKKRCLTSVQCCGTRLLNSSK
jgi:hypothetical protein